MTIGLDLATESGEWVKYDGNNMPVSENAKVRIRTMDGVETEALAAYRWDWHLDGGFKDITHYCIVEQPPKGIGDVTSNEKGAGARYNAGKAPLELIPLRIIVEERRKFFGESYSAELDALEALAAFQEGGDVSNLIDAIQAIGSQWDECAAVFEYGKRKYAEWNWAKGMPWSVPIACAARHILYGIMQGEENDKESGLPHRGHFICNIVMLWTYAHTYKEGDDRPKQWLSGLSKDIYQELECAE